MRSRIASAILSRIGRPRACRLMAPDAAHYGAVSHDGMGPHRGAGAAEFLADRFKPFDPRRVMMLFRRRLAHAAADTEGSAGTAAADSTGPGASAILDPASLQQLRELDPDGRSGLMKKVAAAFRTSTGRLLPQLVEAAANGNLDAVRYVAHTLKSSSAPIGALRLSRLCADLEHQIRFGGLVELDRQVAQIAEEIGVVLQALEVLMDGPQ